jgi:hypothetical protein
MTVTLGSTEVTWIIAHENLPYLKEAGIKIIEMEFMDESQDYVKIKTDIDIFNLSNIFYAGTRKGLFSARVSD